MSFLITGIDGFVGSHLLTHLEKDGFKVYGTSRRKENIDDKKIFFLDLTSLNSIEQVLLKTTPQYLILLAGFSSMKESFAKKEECLLINYESSKKFLTIIRKHQLKIKVLLISSAMVYCPSDATLKEDSPLCPQTSPYSDAKIKQEQLIDDFKDIEIICSRSFNHTGVGQSDNFIVPMLAKAFAETKGVSVSLTLGNLDSKRDFLDVEDVCNAYKILLQEKTKHKIYNVCSGKSWSVEEIIKIFEKVSGKKAQIKIDEEKKESNAPFQKIKGDNSLIKKDTSWKPQIPFEKTIQEMYQRRIKL